MSRLALFRGNALALWIIIFSIIILIESIARGEDRPEFICRSTKHATIVGRKAEACPTYVTERKTRAQLRQTIRAALGIYGKREVDGVVKSYRCEWQ